MKNLKKISILVVLLVSLISLWNCTNQDLVVEEEDVFNLNTLVKRQNDSNKILVYRDIKIYIKYREDEIDFNRSGNGQSIFDSSFFYPYVRIQLDQYGISHQYDEEWYRHKEIGFIYSYDINSEIHYYPESKPNNEDRIRIELGDLENMIIYEIVESPPIG